MKDDRPTEKADIGFFDICVGDLPYGQTVEGWCATRRCFFKKMMLIIFGKGQMAGQKKVRIHTSRRYVGL